MSNTEQRLGKVEESEVSARISLAKIASKVGPHTISAGVGAAIMAAIMRLLLSSPAVPPNSVDQVKPDVVKPADPIKP